MPLTVCPLSNLKLCVVNDMGEHNIRRLLQKVCMFVNSDDPSYFGGYMNDNFVAIQQVLDLSNDEFKQLVINLLRHHLFLMRNAGRNGLQKLKRFKCKTA